MSKLLAESSSVTVLSLYLAKHVFQVHCIDGEGRAVVNPALRRRELR
jgi:transposase